MHRGGFTAVRKEDQQDQETGKLKIILEANGGLLSVDEDDVEKVSFAKYIFFINIKI